MHTHLYIYYGNHFWGPRSATPRNSKKGVEGSGTAVISGISVPGSNESYERLFNPQWGTVRSKQGPFWYLVVHAVEILYLTTSDYYW